MSRPEAIVAVGAFAGGVDRALPAAGLVVLLAIWESVVRGFAISDAVAPSPTAIARALYFGLSSGIFVDHILITAVECVLALAVAVAVGMIVGSAVVQSPLLDRAIYPLIVAFQTTPKVALAPIVIVLFGHGIESKVVLGAMIASFPILVGQIAGLKSCDSGKIDIMRALSASEWQIFRLVKFPSGLPHLFAGIHVGAVFAVLGVVTGELIGATKGLGSLIVIATSDLDTARVFAVLVILGLLGFGLYTAVGVLQRYVSGWSVPIAGSWTER
jgi:NitT/TauT family transport system permease protein